MNQKVFVIVSLLCSLSMFSGCGGGGSGSTSSVSTAGNPTEPGIPTAAGAATLEWEAPVTNTDGTSLTDLEGFKVHYGTSTGSYSESVDVGNVTTCSIGLPPGVYYITVTAYNTGGTESDFSNEVEKTVL